MHRFGFVAIICVVPLVACVPRGAPAPSDGGSDAAPDVVPFEFFGGFIIQEFSAPIPTDSYAIDSAVAVFVARRTIVEPQPAPLIHSAGSCEMREGAGTDGMFDVQSLDPGPITVRGANDFPVITFSPFGGGYLGDLPPDLGNVWADGDELTFEVVGGPSFGSALFTMLAPAQAGFLEPAVSNGAIGGILRSDDLVFVWPVPLSGDGEISIMLWSSVDLATVTCAFSDSGSATIPAKALQWLPPGDIYVHFSRTRRSEGVNADGYFVRAELSSMAVVPATLE